MQKQSSETQTQTVIVSGPAPGKCAQCGISHGMTGCKHSDELRKKVIRQAAWLGALSGVLVGIFNLPFG